MKFFGALVGLVLSACAAQAQNSSFLATDGTFKSPFTVANTWTGLQAFNSGLTAPTRAVGDNTTNVATTAFVLANSIGTAGAPVIPLAHPSSGNLVGTGCGTAHQVPWADQNVCDNADIRSLTSRDPSALLQVTIGGTITAGDRVRLTFTFAGACVAGCNADYTTVGGDTTVTVAAGLACAIANSASLFDLNGSTCTSGVVAQTTTGYGGYRTGKQIGYVVSSNSTTVAVDFDATVAMAVTSNVNGAATETVTIANTNCGVACSNALDNNPSILTSRRTADGNGVEIAPPTNSVISNWQVSGTSSAAPSTLGVTYGQINHYVVNSTTGNLASKWCMSTVTPTNGLACRLYAGLGIYTGNSFDGGADTINAGAAISSHGGGTPATNIGASWSFTGGATPISYCFNWATSTYINCVFLGLSFDFKPSNGTGGWMLSANKLAPDASLATDLGDGTHIVNNAWIKTVNGGGAANSTLTLESTSGAGTTDSIIWKTASQVTRATMLSNGNLGVGTETNPQASLVVSQNTQTGIPIGANTQVAIVGADAASPLLEMDGYGTGSAGTFVFRDARGTGNTPSNSITGDFLGIFGARPFTNGAFTTVNTGRIDFVFTDASPNNGTAIVFDTTPNGTTTRAEAVRVQGSGGMSIGNTVDPGIGSLIANSHLQLGSSALTLSAGEVGLPKITASGTAPGAGGLKFEAVAGTNAGTCKIIAYAGTSNTPVTIVDNIGAGC